MRLALIIMAAAVLHHFDIPMPMPVVTMPVLTISCAIAAAQDVTELLDRF